MSCSCSRVAEGPSHSLVTTDNVQSKGPQFVAFTSKREVSKGNNMIVRRSNRLRSLGFFGKRQGKEPVQHIDITDSDGDDELHVEPISLKPIRGVSSTEIEVDFPVHTVRISLVFDVLLIVSCYAWNFSLVLILYI